MDADLAAAFAQIRRDLPHLSEADGRLLILRLLALRAWLAEMAETAESADWLAESAETAGSAGVAPKPTSNPEPAPHPATLPAMRVVPRRRHQRWGNGP